MSPWTKSKKQELDKFITTNSFEKVGQRTFLGYLGLASGWYLIVCGVLASLGTIRHIFDPISNSGLGTTLMLGSLSAACIWFGRFIVISPILPVPDEEALAKKTSFEQIIEERRQEVEKAATKKFQMTRGIKSVL